MIDHKIKCLVDKLNYFITNNPDTFNNQFNIRLNLSIENKLNFIKGRCGAITAGGSQCSRKPGSDSMFCGLHRCDEKAHKRKKNRTNKYVDINDNYTTTTYNITYNKFRYIKSITNTIQLKYKNQLYLLDSVSNILYKKNANTIIELGNFYRFNYNFQYI